MENQRRVLENKLEPWFELNNKVVMVTGASSGLGWEFCLDLAKGGCRIIAAARRVDRLKSLCEQINDSFSFTTSAEPTQAQPRAVIMELDISAQEPIIATQIKKAWDVFGRIDALVNNAGARERSHAPLDLSEEEWSKIIRTNQTGTWLVSKCVCKHMRNAKRGGCVINISSIAAVNRVIYPGGHAYAASKTAIDTVTKVMAVELGEYNIRVNSISPGIFESEITRALMQKEWLNKVFTKLIPLGTFGTTNPALTSLVRYLIHDSSQYVTGNDFIVDAGTTLVGVPIFSSL